jgi:hypothetical protein
MLHIKYEEARQIKETRKKLSSSTNTPKKAGKSGGGFFKRIMK